VSVAAYDHVYNAIEFLQESSFSYIPPSDQLLYAGPLRPEYTTAI
jgi:hypothetical protein